MVHMRKGSRRRAIAGSKIPSKFLPEENPLLAAILVKQVPSRARVLLVGVASAAFETAVSEDAEAVLVEFALLRETFRELEAIFEQMSRLEAPTTPAEEASYDAPPRIPVKQQRTARRSENSNRGRR
jgi:hypothetical protein